MWSFCLPQLYSQTVWDRSSSYKIDYVIAIRHFLNPKVHQNPISVLKVTAILMKGWILPIGGVALGRVCVCSLRSRLVFQVFSSHFSFTFLIFYRYFPSTLPILSWYFPCTFSISSYNCPDTILIFSGTFHGAFLILFRYIPVTFWVVFLNFPSTFPVPAQKSLNFFLVFEMYMNF